MPRHALVAILLLAVLALPPPSAASATCARVPFVVEACADPQGQTCFDAREGIEGCAGAGGVWASDAPPAEYRCEDLYPQPNCCPYWQGCAGERQIACIDELNGPYWRVGTQGTSAVLLVSRWCYFLHCDVETYCPLDRRLMYRVRFLEAP